MNTASACYADYADYAHYAHYAVKGVQVQACDQPQSHGPPFLGSRLYRRHPREHPKDFQNVFADAKDISKRPF